MKFDVSHPFRRRKRKGWGTELFCYCGASSNPYSRAQGAPTVPCLRRRVGDDGHKLLCEDVERIAREARGLDVSFVHGARYGGACYQVGAVLGEEDALADRIHVVAGAADALHAAGHRRWSFDLDDKVYGAHVDTEFQSRCGAKGANLTGLQLFLDDGALSGGQRAVMGAGNRFAGEFVQRTGKPLGHLAAVDKKDRRVAFANDLEQAGMNRVPD